MQIETLEQNWWRMPATDRERLLRAKWIWAENPNYDLVNQFSLFRKKFCCAEKPVRASLLITADTSYHLYLNGRFVGSGPARGYQRSWPYDSMEVSKYLVAGENLLAVRAYNAGRGSFQYRSEGFAGLLVHLDVDGSEVVSGRDGWRCRRQTGIRRDAVPFSIQLYPQEHVDLREEACDWMLPGFDDEDWAFPVVDRPCFSPPWEAMEPRGIPMLNEGDRSDIRFSVIGESRGRQAACVQGRDVLVIGQEEGLEHKACALGSGRLEMEAGPGEFHSLLLDLGRVQIGRLLVQFEDCQGGEIFDFYFSEIIEDGVLSPVVNTQAWNRVSMGNRLVASPGKGEHLFYHPVGFRYLVVRARNLAKPVGVRLMLKDYRFPLERRVVFEQSDASVADIFDACGWTQQLCALDAFVDTPWREQAQWWGDARIQGANCLALAGDVRLLDRGIRSIAQQRTVEGLTYGTAPGVSHGCVLPDFALTWIMTLWDHYWHTGETWRYRENREGAFDVIGYFRSHKDPARDLVGKDDRFWLFLDWAPHAKEGFPVLLNLLLLEALGRMQELEERIGMEDQLAELSELQRDLRRGLAGLVDEETGLICEGWDSSGNRYESHSLLAQVLACSLDLEGIDRDRVIDGYVRPFLRREPVDAILPSLAFQTRLFAFAIEQGLGMEVLGYIKAVWGPMTSATHTTWEVLDYRKGVHSFSHAWSAHPLHHLLTLFSGLRPVEAGWRRVVFEPCLCGSTGKFQVPTPGGDCLVAWQQSAEGICVTLSVPDGMTIYPKIAGIDSDRCLVGDHRWLIEAH